MRVTSGELIDFLILIVLLGRTVKFNLLYIGNNRLFSRLNPRIVARNIDLLRPVRRGCFWSATFFLQEKFCDIVGINSSKSKILMYDVFYAI